MCSRLLLKSFIFWVIVFFIIFLSPQKLFAASISAQNGPTQIGPTDEYTVDVTLSISAKDTTQYYLRGVFYLPGTTNYCGYTWNGASWFNGPYSSNNGWENFLPVTITSNTWTGQLKAKLDTNDPGCSSSGQYAFKIERFTSSGSSNFDTQTEQTVVVVIPTPTPTPTPLPTPTNTPIPPSATATPKPTATPTLKPTSTPMPKNTPTSKVLQPTLNTEMGSDNAILGTMSATSLDLLTPTPYPTELIASDTEKKSFSLVPGLFFLAGFCLLATCAILIFYKTDKGQALWKKFF